MKPRQVIQGGIRVTFGLGWEGKSSDPQGLGDLVRRWAKLGASASHLLAPKAVSGKHRRREDLVVPGASSWVQPTGTRR